MDLRINLLPPEILEARRWEKWYQWVFLGSAALLLVVLLAAAFLLLQINLKESQLQGLKEQSKTLSDQARAFEVFEKRQQELDAQRAVVGAAMTNRVNLGRIADEISLVLPEEVWLATLSIGESSGLSVSGFTPLSDSQSASIGYKSVAKTMVRLSTLTDLADIWLGGASSTEYSAWQVEKDETAPSTARSVVQFEINGKVLGGRPETGTE